MPDKRIVPLVVKRKLMKVGGSYVIAIPHEYLDVNKITDKDVQDGVYFFIVAGTDIVLTRDEGRASDIIHSMSDS
jgi:hypothetical protein